MNIYLHSISGQGLYGYTFITFILHLFYSTTKIFTLPDGFTPHLDMYSSSPPLIHHCFLSFPRDETRVLLIEKRERRSLSTYLLTPLNSA